MRWLKLYLNFDDPDKWTSKADNDELGAWFRLMRMAGKSDNKGVICITPDLPYSIEQIKTVIKTDKDYIKKWEKQGAISVKNGIITINNWALYQSEYDRQKPYRDSYKERLQGKVTSKGYKQSDTVDIDIDLEVDKEVNKENTKTKEHKYSPVKFWYDAYLAEKQTKYAIDPETTKGEEAGKLADLLKIWGKEEFEAKIVQFLKETNFTAQKGGTLRHNVNILWACRNDIGTHKEKVYGIDDGSDRNKYKLDIISSKTKRGE